MSELSENPIKTIVIDYDMGNLSSVCRACEFAGLTPVISDDKNKLLAADIVLLPGVGAFGDAMDRLREKDLISPIKDYIETGKLFVGICLGMQLLGESSEEFGVHEGLKIIQGKVVKFPEQNPENDLVKIPQVGWNRIDFDTELQKNPPLDEIENGEYMYFIHSFHFKDVPKENILANTTYMGITYPSGIYKNNVYAFQFHPEISGREGLKLYENFRDMAIKKRSEL